MVEVVFQDDVLADIDTFVARFRPERGGALVGPIGLPVVSQFIPDPDASTSGVTFSPSIELERKVLEITRSGELEMKGILHSHPNGMSDPSSGDQKAFTNKLRQMPWLGYFIAPIVTSCAARKGGAAAHQLLLPNGELSVHVAELREGGAVVLRATPRTMPIMAAIHTLESKWGRGLVRVRGSRMVYAPLDGHLHASSSFLDDAGTMVTMMVPYTFPLAPPILLVSAVESGGQATTMPLTWDLAVPDEERFASALSKAISGPTSAAEMVALSKPVPSGVREGLRERLDGALATSVQQAKVLIVGLGSGGSQTAEALARASVEAFTIIDPDIVEAANLSRSTYDAEDIGSSKVEALTRRLRAINPDVEVRGYAVELNELSPEQLADLVSEVDLVIAATDDPDAQHRLNRVAWSTHCPAVFAGVYEKGSAGEVIFTVPGITACFHCATGGQRGGRRGTAQINYGTGTLIAEPALGADIAHVVSASTKIALGLLELSDPQAAKNSAASMVAQAAASGRTFLEMSMVPNYDFFPKLFSGVPGQHAYQSVWLGTTSNPECQTCGAEPVVDQLHHVVDVAALMPVVEGDKIAEVPGPLPIAPSVPYGARLGIVAFVRTVFDLYLQARGRGRRNR